MQPLFSIVAILALALAACMVAVNWVYVVANYRFYRQGSKRRISFIQLAPQLLVFVAAVLSSNAFPQLLPGWLFWLVASVDPGLLQIIFHPVFLLFKARAQ